MLRKPALALFAFYLLFAGVILFKSDRVIRHDNLTYHWPVFSRYLQQIRAHHALPRTVPFGESEMPSVVLANNWFTLLVSRLPFYLLAGLTPFSFDTMALYKWNLMLNAVLLGVGMLLLLRELQFRRETVLWGTAITLFSGIGIATFSQEQVGVNVLFLPYLLALAVRYARSHDGLTLCLFAGVLGQALVNHYPHLTLYPLIIAGLAFRPKLKMKMGRAALAAALALLLFAPSLVSFLKYKDDLVSPRRGGDLQATEIEPGNRLEPRVLLSYPLPESFLGRTWLATQELPDTLPYYIGTLGFLLTLVGTVRGPRPLVVGCWLSLAGLLVFALGWVHPLLFRLGGIFQLQRIPVHLGIFLNIPLIVLACTGLERIKNRNFFLAVLVLSLLEIVLLSERALRSSTVDANIPPCVSSLGEGCEAKRQETLQPAAGLLQLRRPATVAFPDMAVQYFHLLASVLVGAGLVLHARSRP